MGLLEIYMQKLAGLDSDSENLRRILAGNMQTSKENRAKSLLSSREADAGRGLLQSSSAFGNQVDVNTNYDKANAQLQQSFDTNLSEIQRKKLDAENEYQTQQLEIERQKAADAAALKLQQEQAAKALDPAPTGAINASTGAQAQSTPLQTAAATALQSRIAPPRAATPVNQSRAGYTVNPTPTRTTAPGAYDAAKMGRTTPVVKKQIPRVVRF